MSHKDNLAVPFLVDSDEGSINIGKIFLQIFAKESIFSKCNCAGFNATVFIRISSSVCKDKDIKSTGLSQDFRLLNLHLEFSSFVQTRITQIYTYAPSAFVTP